MRERGRERERVDRKRVCMRTEVSFSSLKCLLIATSRIFMFHLQLPRQASTLAAAERLLRIARNELIAYNII